MSKRISTNPVGELERSRVTCCGDNRANVRVVHGQRVVRCATCDAFLYNQPKHEAIEPERSDAEELAALLRVVHATRVYVYARYALRGADTGSMLEACMRVDDAWHELTIAIGDHDPECCGCDDALDRIVEDVHDEKGRL